MIDIKYIEEFRKTINELTYLKNQLYDYNGKSLWNVVCSAMDWVETAANWLSYHDGPEVQNEPYSDSMNVMFYLSAIDMLYEGVAQLYRVFFGNLCGKGDAILMDGDTGIFGDIKYCKDDKTYFKEIRAIFGEHSVKLDLRNLYYPPEDHKKHEKEKWFASWSFNCSGGSPSDVYIYNRGPGVTAELFSADMTEVKAFADTVYSHVPIITTKAIELDRKRIENIRNQDWPDFADDISAKLGYLFKENQKRTDNDIYRNALHEIELILKSELKNELVLKLKEKALIVLNGMEEAFQRAEDTDCYETIEPHLHMDYTVSKGYTSLCVNVVEGYHDSDYLIWGEQLRDFVSELVDVSDRMTLEDQYVLITAALIEMEESAKER